MTRKFVYLQKLKITNEVVYTRAQIDKSIKNFLIACMVKTDIATPKAPFLEKLYVIEKNCILDKFFVKIVE